MEPRLCQALSDAVPGTADLGDFAGSVPNHLINANFSVKGAILFLLVEGTCKAL